MKREAKIQAQNMFLKAGGRITNRDIAKSVKVNALTIGRWKREEDWESKLRGGDYEVRDSGGVIRKKEAKDKALSLYMDASGNVTNKDLAIKVGVSPATISKWKETDNWIGKLSNFDEGNGHDIEESELDIDELVSPEQIIKINRRIDSLLKRDYLSAGEISDLAVAKSDLLEAVEIYLAIAREVGELRISQ
jgi:uncharacterized protein YjcR